MTSCRPSGWSDVFDATFIISLQRRRSTRLELLGRQLQQLGRVAYTVHPAVDGASLNRTAWQRRMYNVKNSSLWPAIHKKCYDGKCSKNAQ